MKRLILTILFFITFFTSCDKRDLPVNDFIFRAEAAMQENAVPIGTIVNISLVVSDYKASEDLILTCWAGDSIPQLVINGVKVAGPYVFSPAANKQLHICYVPQKRGTHKLRFNIANSHYSTQADLQFRATEDVSYTYEYNGYNITIINKEGL